MNLSNSVEMSEGWQSLVSGRKEFSGISGWTWRGKRPVKVKMPETSIGQSSSDTSHQRKTTFGEIVSEHLMQIDSLSVTQFHQ
jgi:hypothetical protein